MKITKIINNNTVATSANKKEIILMGSGIGFQKKAGDTVDVEKIEKVFQVRDRFVQKYEQIFKHIQPRYFKMAEMIRIRAEKELSCVLSPQFIFALADHIAFAIERQKNGEPMPKLMLHEIRLLYEREYQIGEYGRRLVEKEEQITFPADEAGYFALHIVNSKTEESSVDVNNVLILTNGILNIIHEHFAVNCREDDFEYSRFLMHLKFLAARIFTQKQYGLNVMGNMLPELTLKEPKLTVVLPEIRAFIEETFDYRISAEEAAYLAVYIIRITGK